jgi:FtsP/CotA-like multicopper oxidase with cupredoxin domain
MASLRISRRRFLRLASLGGASLAGMACFNRLEGASGFTADPTPTMEPHGKAPAAEAETSFAPDAEIELTAVEKTVQILPGMATRVLGYEGRLLGGTGATVQALPNNYLGPIIRAKTGARMRLIQRNGLREETVLHPHGLRVPEDCDGTPMQAFGPGQTKVYEFQVVNHAGPYWFHPHPMDTTPEQVYYGMAGLFYVWDDAEEQAVPGASTGANDVPVIIQDRAFDANNQLVYMPNMMWGFLGDRILVNGVLNARCALEPRAYRLRLLNGSNARTYRLAWSNGMPLLVIGTDGGLLPEAVSKNAAILMPGERLDLWADFSALAGQQVTLVSLPFEAGMGMMGGMGGMGAMSGTTATNGIGGLTGMGRMASPAMQGRGMGGMGMGMGMMGGISMGSPIDILKVNVGETASASPVLGPLPPLAETFTQANVPNFASPRPFILSMAMMMQWTINGRQYEMEGVAPEEIFYLDVPIAWEFINYSMIPHPMHIHNAQFQVVQRTPSPMPGYAGVQDGFVGGGWKDTVAIWPGERVKIAMRFGPHAGMYMYHCHILEHEDMGMMRNLLVQKRS